MREQLLKILREVRPDVDFESEKELVDGKVLDSFDIIQIVLNLNEAFDVEISVEDLEPVNFNSIQGMIELLKKREG